MQTALGLGQVMLLAPCPHALPRFVVLPQTLYVWPVSVTGLHWLSDGIWFTHALWFGTSHEIQQSWWRQIEPIMQSPGMPSPSWPSLLQVKVAAWFGMQPFSVQTSPGVGQVMLFSGARGTQ